MPMKANSCHALAKWWPPFGFGHKHILLLCLPTLPAYSLDIVKVMGLSLKLGNCLLRDKNKLSSAAAQLDTSPVLAGTDRLTVRN